MDVFKKRHLERAHHQLHLKTARNGFKLSVIFGALTLATSLWINMNMDDGERFDLHQQIPGKVEQALQEQPSLNRERLTEYGNGLADDWEKNIRLSTLVFSLASIGVGAFWHRRKEKLERAEQENPHLRMD